MNKIDYDSFKRENTFHIVFTYIGWGWIEVTFVENDVIFKTRFSDVHDPLYDFKHWLEAICTRVQQCSFEFNPEGPDEKRFGYDKYKKNSFYISEINRSNRGSLLFETSVSRYYLVSTIYKAFLDFIDTYKLKERNIPWNGIDFNKTRSTTIENYLNSNTL